MDEVSLIAQLKSSDVSTETSQYDFFLKMHAGLCTRKKKSSFKGDKADTFDLYLMAVNDVTSEQLSDHFKAVAETYALNEHKSWEDLVTRGFATRNLKAVSKRRKIEKNTEYSHAVQDLSQDTIPVDIPKVEVKVEGKVEGKVEEKVEEKVEDVEEKVEDVEEKVEVRTRMILCPLNPHSIVCFTFSPTAFT